MRFVAALLVAMMIPAFGTAGTRVSPEISDPPGDTILPGTPWADITQVWFSSEHDAAGSLTSVLVHVGAAGALPDGQGVGFSVDWSVDAGQSEYCGAGMSVWRTQPDESLPHIPPQASLYYWCDGDENSHSIGPLTVAVSEGVETTFAALGSETVVVIPVSALTGEMRLNFRDGARLTAASAQSSTVTSALVWLEADRTGCPIVEISPECSARPYVIGE